MSEINIGTRIIRLLDGKEIIDAYILAFLANNEGEIYALTLKQFFNFKNDNEEKIDVKISEQIFTIDPNDVVNFHHADLSFLIAIKLTKQIQINLKIFSVQDFCHPDLFQEIILDNDAYTVSNLNIKYFLPIDFNEPIITLSPILVDTELTDDLIGKIVTDVENNLVGWAMGTHKIANIIYVQTFIGLSNNLSNDLYTQWRLAENRDIYFHNYSIPTIPDDEPPFDYTNKQVKIISNEFDSELQKQPQYPRPTQIHQATSI